MRKRRVACAGSQTGCADGSALTMPRALTAFLILVILTPNEAWRPPYQHQIFTVPAHVRSPRHAHGSIRHLHILGWHLELQENRAIRSPYYNECEFYKGRVLYEDESKVTVTECGGQLYGLLQVDGEEYVLQPTRPQGSHVLRRRDVVMSEKPVAYNLTDDTFTDLDVDFDDEPTPGVFVRSRNDKSDVEYYRDVLPLTRPVAGVKGLWLELAIVADHTILKFHGKERVKHYILAIMNIVSAIFNDRSLDSNMTLVINKLFLHDEKEAVIKSGNVKKSLESVNKWNYRHLIKLPPGSTGWDAAVWLTRAQLGGPSGFAPVSGVCTRLRSAAIGRDEGLTSAFVIAHELAHLMGVTHDDPGQCEYDNPRGSVMASTVLATLHNYAWSSCSKEQFHERTQKLWCLHERSGDEGVELGGTKELSNYVFTMDEQCRTEFGEGFSVCMSVKVRSSCSRLWCAHRSVPHVCRTKRAPPLEGTPCGNNQWCVDRVCETMPGQRVENKIDEKPMPPEWGEWSEWSGCSVSCGYGLRTRTRRCHYRGSTLEAACDGAGSQVVTCWAGSACPSTRDIRADWCLHHGSHLIPHVHAAESNACELWCVAYDGGNPSSFGVVPDGSPCSYNRPYDLCSQGTCVKGHCNSSDPGCNWCPDGYCYNHTNTNHRQLTKGWTKLTLVPQYANQVSIHIATPIPLKVAIRETKRDRPIIELIKHSKRIELDNTQDNYLKYDPHVPQNLRIIEVDSNIIDIKEGGSYGWEGSVVAAGSVIQWKQTDTDVIITSSTRLQTSLIILATPEHSLIDEEIPVVEVTVNFSTRHTRPMEYRWPTQRGPCSVSCGGGFRAVRGRCGRDHQCATTYERCNMHSCEFSWAPGEWEECSATCGESGVQERQLFCVPANTSIHLAGLTRRDLVRLSVSPALCLQSKPDKQQRCNRIPCPVYWQELPWTPCSTSCGRGVSYRPLVCPAAEEVLCGPKPRQRRRRCRLRRCPPRPQPHVCTGPDTTQYCEYFTTDVLERHCTIPPFRKHCCNACKSVHPTHIDGVP